MKRDSIVKIPLNPPLEKGDLSEGYSLEKRIATLSPPLKKGGQGGFIRRIFFRKEILVGRQAKIR